MDDQRNAEEKRVAFLKAQGWGDAVCTPLAADASARCYERLILKGKTRLLMRAPAVSSHHGTGYEAEARLANSSLSAFVCLARLLKERGFSAPDIEAFETETGFALIEDFGDRLYARLLEQGADEVSLYTEAVRCLAALYRCSFPRDLSWREASWHLQDYDDRAMLVEAGLFLDWYAPSILHKSYEKKERADWVEAWQHVFLALKKHAYGLVLRDFHAENIFLLPQRKASARLGLIDFQDAVFGHPAYDLVSLLEDARRDVNPALIAPMMTLYLDKTGLGDKESFYAAYAVSGAQRNAKILGIFARLAQRDHKKRYLDLIPRVRRLFAQNLQHPGLAPVRVWFAAQAPELLDAECSIQESHAIKNLAERAEPHDMTGVSS